MKRIAVIGCGRIAPAHLDALRSLSSRTEIAALCDLDEDLLRERQQAYDIPNTFASLEALLAWGAFDIAAVLTPPDIRAEVCVPLLGAGKHLLVEKPFTHSLAEAQTIVAAAEKAGVTLAVNQNFRWMPPAPLLREGILARGVGDILSFTLIDTVWRDEPEGWRNAADKLALSVMGVHWLDRIRWLTQDEGASIYTASRISGLLTSAGEDITSTVIRLRSGGIATLVHHWASHARGVNNCLQIDGTEGSVTVREGAVLWQRRGGEPQRAGFEGIPLWHSMAASWAELLDSIERGVAPCHSGQDNLGTVALLEGAYRSAETGNVIPLGVE